MGRGKVASGGSRARTARWGKKRGTAAFLHSRFRRDNRFIEFSSNLCLTVAKHAALPFYEADEFFGAVVVQQLKLSAEPALHRRS